MRLQSVSSVRIDIFGDIYTSFAHISSSIHNVESMCESEFSVLTQTLNYKFNIVRIIWAVTIKTQDVVLC